MTLLVPLRKKLVIKQGDAVVFEIEGVVVSVRCVTALDKGYLAALAGTLSEWASDNDERAYRRFLKKDRKITQKSPHTFLH